MGYEKKSGKKVESKLATSLHVKFMRKCRKANISAAQRIRDLIQKDVKR